MSPGNIAFYETKYIAEFSVLDANIEYGIVLLFTIHIIIHCLTDTGWIRLLPEAQANTSQLAFSTISLHPRYSASSKKGQ